MVLMQLDNGTKFGASAHSKDWCAKSGNKPDMTLAMGLLLHFSRSHRSGTKACQCSNKGVSGIIFNPTLLNQPRNTITQLFCNSNSRLNYSSKGFIGQKTDNAGA
jgi:hypothetical protein|tara:strand:+ start:836 stop:1150 length:315 start_codon:yes stop_codon:yes gene_type:complete